MKVHIKKNILLVEDEFLIAIGKQKELEKYGYTVQHVNTGEKAVTIVSENIKIDLILMDIDLGKGIDGTEAAAIILEDCNLPIVFMSSHTEPEIVEKNEKITSYGYVVKNSSITVLDASIKMAFKLFEAHYKISESELRLRLSVNAIKAGTWIWNIETGEVIWDDKMQEIFGFQQGEYDGTYEAWKNLVHPDDREDADFQTKTAFKNGTDYDFKYRLNIMSEYGEWRTVKAQAIVVSNSKGERVSMAGFCVDITKEIIDAKLQKREIELNAERFKLWKSSTFIGILQSNSRGDIIDANDAFLNMLGYTRQDLLD